MQFLTHYFAAIYCFGSPILLNKLLGGISGREKFVAGVFLNNTSGVGTQNFALALRFRPVEEVFWLQSEKVPRQVYAPPNGRSIKTQARAGSLNVRIYQPY